MTNDPSYRLYLEEKFTGQTKHMHAQFKIVHDALERIEDQTTKHNDRMSKIEKAAIEHPLNCSNGKEIAAIKEYISNSNVIKSKNRRIFEGTLKVIGVIFAAVALGLSSYFGFRNNEKSDEMLTKQNNQGVPFVTNKRGEFVVLPDSSRIKFFPNDSIVYIMTKKYQ